MNVIAFNGTYAVTFERLYRIAGQPPAWRSCIDYCGGKASAQKQALSMLAKPEFRAVKVVRVPRPQWAAA